MLTSLNSKTKEGHRSHLPRKTGCLHSRKKKIQTGELIFSDFQSKNQNKKTPLELSSRIFFFLSEKYGKGKGVYLGM